MSGFLARLQGYGASGWRRASAVHPFVVLWLVMAFSLLTFSILTMGGHARHLVEALPVLRDRPVRSLSDAPEGKGVFHGVLRGSVQRSPHGTVGIGWYAWVDRVVRHGKSASRQRVCSVAELGGLALEDGGRSAMLALDADALDVQTVDLRPRRVALIASVSDHPVPPDLSKREPCAGRLSGELEYHEIVWDSRQDAVVSACKRGGTVVPCGDGADFVVSRCDAGTCTDAERGRRTIEHAARSPLSIGMAFLFAMFGALLGGLSGFVLAQHRKQEARRRALARPA